MCWFFQKSYFMVQFNLGVFHIVPQENLQKLMLTDCESQNLPKMQDLDAESQFSQFEWTLHNGRQNCLKINIQISKIDLLQYRRKKRFRKICRKDNSGKKTVW